MGALSSWALGLYTDIWTCVAPTHVHIYYTVHCTCTYTYRAHPLRSATISSVASIMGMASIISFFAGGGPRSDMLSSRLDMMLSSPLAPQTKSAGSLVADWAPPVLRESAYNAYAQAAFIHSKLHVHLHVGKTRHLYLVHTITCTCMHRHTLEAAAWGSSFFHVQK